MTTEQFVLWCLRNGVNPYPRVMVGRPIEDDEIIYREDERTQIFLHYDTGRPITLAEYEKLKAEALQKLNLWLASTGLRKS